MIVVLQEEIEAQIKADKIKMALEKLKEAKVKKVSRVKTVHCMFYIQRLWTQPITPTGKTWEHLPEEKNMAEHPLSCSHLIGQ